MLAGKKGLYSAVHSGGATRTGDGRARIRREEYPAASPTPTQTSQTDESLVTHVSDDEPTRRAAPLGGRLD